MSQQNDEVLPQYPYLSCCAVVDSRFSSRGEIVKDLKAVSLFENVIEPESLARAIEILGETEVDVCILGPSVSFEKAKAFIDAGGKLTKSARCAFIAILNPNEKQNSQWNSSGAHGFVQKPYSKQTLSEQIVHSVVRANQDSPWAALLGGRRADSFIEPKEAAGALPAAEKNEVIGRGLLEVMSRLQPLIDGHTAGRFKLMLSGGPNEAARAAIEDLSADILSTWQVTGRQRQLLARCIQSALSRWFENMVLTDAGTAETRLRSDLLSGNALLS
jgi:hypothetical protein